MIHGKGEYKSDDFRKYAQPSDKLLKQYSEATGLPIIIENTDRISVAELKKNTGLDEKKIKEDPISVWPYIVSIEVSKQINGENQNKVIKYGFTSQKAYEQGRKPDMIYMSGIAGKTGCSGMFRLLPEGRYIDNGTFRAENGGYTFETKSYEEIMNLAGKMPTQLSEKAHLAATGKTVIPQKIQEIYDKCASLTAQEQEAMPEPESGRAT